MGERKLVFLHKILGGSPVALKMQRHTGGGGSHHWVSHRGLRPLAPFIPPKETSGMLEIFVRSTGRAPAAFPVFVSLDRGTSSMT